MESLKLLFQIYVKPFFAFSELMDRGSWLSSAIIALVVSAGFFFSVNVALNQAYSPLSIADFYSNEFLYDISPAVAEKHYLEAKRSLDEAMQQKRSVPLVGDRFFSFASFDPTVFYRPLIVISIFAVPIMILVISVFGGTGSFGLLMRREYMATITCLFIAFAAAHLPATAVGIASFWIEISPNVLFFLWLASGLLYIVYSTFAVRTVFGVGFSIASVAVLASLPASSIATFMFGYVSPWLLSPFILIWAVIIFGTYLGGEFRSLGDAFRTKQNLKRFLENSTVNPRDADAHVQLGLIYLERRQEQRAAEHFRKALEIDKTEIDANFELGKLERKKGSLQVALDHFSVVLEQDDKYRLSEIWREIGAAYLAAEMWPNAFESLEKYVDRRPVDPEGLYYLGKVLKQQGESARAIEMFEAAIESAYASPHYRRRQLGQWAKLAAKEL